MKTLFKSAVILAALATAMPVSALDRENRQDRRETREERRDLIVPASCLEGFDTRAGTVTLYTADCLRQGHIETRELPQECLVNFRADGERVRAYEPACLEDAGYRLAGQ